jgi:hypothetical protein
VIRSRVLRERRLVEARLEEEGVLPRVDIVAPATPHLVEAKALVETARLHVGRAHLEERPAGASSAMPEEQRAKEEAPDPLAPPGRVDG